ncbi:MAG: hypothetical protein K9G76_01115 [Bacteroidales bacterium]|nr:hypothetical protein [Bacteroidales bacterium]MCF8402715.1 hypothetical protein [Bacteroidales bacterium]
METPLEHILTSSYKDEMITFMWAHPEFFNEAIQLAISDKQPYAWRAAWLLWSCMEDNDKRILTYISKIIESIKTKKDGHQRELLKILLRMELNEEQEGHIFNTSLDLWEKINKVPSVRFTAFKFIIKIAKKHSDLSNEIAFFTQTQYLDTLSPGVNRSIKKMIKDFKS